MIHETLYVVNVLHEGSWRPLCAHGLSEANGDEICQELGYKYVNHNHLGANGPQVLTKSYIWAILPRMM